MCRAAHAPPSTCTSLWHQGQVSFSISISCLLFPKTSQMLLVRSREREHGRNLRAHAWIAVDRTLSVHGLCVVLHCSHPQSAQEELSASKPWPSSRTVRRNQPDLETNPAVR